MTSDIGRYSVRLLVALLLIALALFAWRIVDVLILAFAAVLVAVLLRGMSAWIARHLGLPSGWALATAIAGVALLVGASGWLFGHEVSAQVDELARIVPQAWAKLKDVLQNWSWGRALLDRLQDAGGDVLSEETISRARSIVTTTVTAVGNVLLVVAGGIYLAANPSLYRRGIVSLVPRSAEDRTRQALDASGHALGQWLKGQVISMTIIGLCTTLGLWLLGMPSALALGLLAGLSEFVPLVGPIASALPALLVASAQGMDMVLYVLALYVAVQQAESYLVMPLVQQELVSLPPALTLFAVVALGLVFGILGVLFATPLLVVVFVLVRTLYVEAALGKGERKE